MTRYTYVAVVGLPNPEVTPLGVVLPRVVNKNFLPFAEVEDEEEVARS